MIAPRPNGGDGGNRSWKLALALVSAAVALRLIFAALIPAFPDETYYWDWSRHLETGYFDHPPVVAWLIRFGGVVLSPFGASVSVLAIRLGPILAGWIAAVATIATARRIAGNEAALRAAIVLAVMPLAAAGLMLATPDAAVLAASSVALYCVVRALEHPPRSSDSFLFWSLSGLALGVAFASKYTSIFLPVAVVATVSLHRALRARLREPGPYVACAIATLVFAPVLVWNAKHGWISFAYQIKHGLSAPQGSALRAAWRHEGDFFGGQAALASPILFVMLGIAVARALASRARPERFVLAMVALLSFGFFVYSAIRQRVEPNWPAPAYMPAIVLLATMPLGSVAKRWLNAGVMLAAAMSVAIYIQGLTPILPIAPPKDPIARAFGWDSLAASAEALARAADPTGNTTWFGGDRYQEASELAFHLPNHPVTFATNLAGRPNQYDLWPRFADVAKPGDNLALAVDEGSEPHQSVRMLEPRFSSVREGDLVTLRRNGREVATRRLWLLMDWDGRPFPTGAP